MLVLGIHGTETRLDEENRHYNGHDSAAILLDDGVLVAAIEEERLNRVKHSNYFPVNAINFCVWQHGVTLDDIDWFAFNIQESNLDTFARWQRLKNANSRLPTNAKALSAHTLKAFLGIDAREKLRFCNHHVAHAWSAFAVSGYQESLVLSVDGGGDNLSGAVFLHEGNRLTLLREFDLPHSLGNLYTDFIEAIGFARFDEYKAMGLAPYGDPAVTRGFFQSCYRLLPDGEYDLHKQPFYELLGRSAEYMRRKGESFKPQDMDFAAGLQEMLETIVLHLLGHYQRETKQKNLCLVGGVAHNCTMNGKIAYSGLFENMFVQPAAHDAGGALGAALSVFHAERPETPKMKLDHLFLGTDLGQEEEIEQALVAWNDFVVVEKLDDVAKQTAQLLADDFVLGWVQGRSEFGPRALGHRSILADPRPAKNKDRINQLIKKREAFRPFAPSVLAEELDRFFELPTTKIDYQFMIYVLRVREQYRKQLGAITHVDSTARVQTVEKSTNPLYWELIREFEKLTGFPIVLNTSFNNNVEPIVDSIHDAATCFLTTGLHYLVIGNRLVKKRQLDDADAAYRSLAPSLPLHRGLLKCARLGDENTQSTAYKIDTRSSKYFSQLAVDISADMFLLLQNLDGEKTLAQLAAEVGIREPARLERITQEAVELWSQRVLILRPPQIRIG